MNPLNWNCAHQNPDLTNCGAGFGDPCDWTHSCADPAHGPFHAERLGLYDGSAAPVSKAIIDDAAEFLGIV